MPSRPRAFAVFCALLSTSTLADAGPRRSDDVSIARRTTLSARQSAGNIDNDSFYRRVYPATVIVDNWLYIDGGEFSYDDGDTVRYEHSTATLAIDLSRSWTNSSVTIKSTEHARGVPHLLGTNLWYNESGNELLQGFVGAASPWPNTNGVQDLCLWSFKLDGKGSGSWSQVYDSRASAFASMTRPYQGSMAQDDGAAYILGGVSTADTSHETRGQPYITLPGLIKYNFTTAEFTNSTATDYHGAGTAARGQMLYVPTYGEKGLYIPLGGDAPRPGKYSPGSSMVGFRNIMMYDPATDRWHSQTTTGAEPKGRIEFCAVGARSTDGTYEIFIYAGWSGSLGDVAIPWDEVFVLSLPAFRWFKVRYEPRHPRHGHACQVVGNRQMLIVGGVDTLQDEVLPFPDSNVRTVDIAPLSTRDQLTRGLGVFDMTRLNFSDRYDADAEPYTQSDLVADYYEQNPRYPTWDNDDVKALMQTESDPRPNPTAPAGSFASPSEAASSGIGSGGIAGIAVGGIVGLSLLGAGAFLLFRRRRKRNDVARQESTSDKGGPDSPGSNGGEVRDSYFRGFGYSEMMAGGGGSKPRPMASELPVSTRQHDRRPLHELNVEERRYDVGDRERTGAESEVLLNQPRQLVELSG